VLEHEDGCWVLQAIDCAFAWPCRICWLQQNIQRARLRDIAPVVSPHRHQPKVPLDFYRYINIFAAVRPRRIHHRLGLKENAVPSGARHPAHLTQPSHQHRVLCWKAGSDALWPRCRRLGSRRVTALCQAGRLRTAGSERFRNRFAIGLACQPHCQAQA